MTRSTEALQDNHHGTTLLDCPIPVPAMTHGRGHKLRIDEWTPFFKRSGEPGYFLFSSFPRQTHKQMAPAPEMLQRNSGMGFVGCLRASFARNSLRKRMDPGASPGWLFRPLIRRTT